MRTIKVEAYAGAGYPEYPRALWLEQTRRTVKQVLHAWYEPGTKHFVIELDGDRQLTVIYHFASECWYVPA